MGGVFEEGGVGLSRRAVREVARVKVCGHGDGGPVGQVVEDAFVTCPHSEGLFVPAQGVKLLKAVHAVRPLPDLPVVPTLVLGEPQRSPDGAPFAVLPEPRVAYGVERQRSLGSVAEFGPAPLSMGRPLLTTRLLFGPMANRQPSLTESAKRACSYPP